MLIHRKSQFCTLILCVLSIVVVKIIYDEVVEVPVYSNARRRYKVKEIQKNVPKAKTQTVISTSTTGYPKSAYMVNRHCVIPNVIKREMEEDPERISLILHSSFDRLKPDIKKQISNWDGPISLTVTFPPLSSLDSKKVLCARKFLKRLHENHYDSLLKLSAHFLLQNLTCSEFDSIKDYPLDNIHCNTLYIRTFLDYMKRKRLPEYPVNEARNLARNLSSTNYIVLADLDHFFSRNFEAKMLSLAKKIFTKDPKTVIVYRIFDLVDKSIKFANTKRNLFELYKMDKAEEFHKYFNGHSIKRLLAWFQNPDHPKNSTEIQFYRSYKSLHWEPQFVSLRTIPFHDTSFYYPFKDNTVLRWEMCRAGYKFVIADDVFMFHMGVKTPEERKIVDRFRIWAKHKTPESLKQFNERMDLLYPETKEKCPDISISSLMIKMGDDNKDTYDTDLDEEITSSSSETSPMPNDE